MHAVLFLFVIFSFSITKYYGKEVVKDVVARVLKTVGNSFIRNCYSYIWSNSSSSKYDMAVLAIGFDRRHIVLYRLPEG